MIRPVVDAMRPASLLVDRQPPRVAPRRRRARGRRRVGQAAACTRRFTYRPRRSRPVRLTRANGDHRRVRRIPGSSASFFPGARGRGCARGGPRAPAPGQTPSSPPKTAPTGGNEQSRAHAPPLPLQQPRSSGQSGIYCHVSVSHQCLPSGVGGGCVAGVVLRPLPHPRPGLLVVRPHHGVCWNIMRRPAARWAASIRLPPQCASVLVPTQRPLGGAGGPAEHGYPLPARTRRYRNVSSWLL